MAIEILKNVWLLKEKTMIHPMMWNRIIKYKNNRLK